MTVYDIPNIEHCTVEEFGNTARMYRIISNEGWFIHLNDGIPDKIRTWKTAVALPDNCDFSIVEIRAKADLPEDAEIYGIVNPPESDK